MTSQLTFLLTVLLLSSAHCKKKKTHDSTDTELAIIDEMVSELDNYLSQEHHEMDFSNFVEINEQELMDYEYDDEEETVGNLLLQNVDSSELDYEEPWDEEEFDELFGYDEDDESSDEDDDNDSDDIVRKFKKLIEKANLPSHSSKGQETAKLPISYDICEHNGKIIDMGSKPINVVSPKENKIPNLMCKVIINATSANALKIKIDNFDVEGGRPKCLGDSLQIFEGYGENTEPVKLSDRICGKKSDLARLVYYSMDNFLVISFSTKEALNDKSFSLSISPIKKSKIPKNELCGTIDEPLEITPQNKQIMSPGFDKKRPYPNNRDCYFNVDLTDGFKIEAVVEFFDVEIAYNCSLDYLEVLDENLKVLKKLCGYYPENKQLFEFENKNLLLHFHSDNSGSNKGFLINTRFTEIEEAEEDEMYEDDEDENELSAVDEDEDDTSLGDRSQMVRRKKSLYKKACKRSKGATLKKYSGSLKSHKHPKKYPNNLKCLYKLRPKKSKYDGVWRIDLESLNIEYGKNCQFDSLRFFEEDENSNLLTNLKICGSSYNKPIFSKTKNLNIQFVSDRSLSHSGFKLRYKFYRRTKNPDSEYDLPQAARPPISVCGQKSELSENRGKISHGDENDDTGTNYMNNLDCNLRINSRDNRKFLIRFNYMNLQDNSEDCSKDFVSIFDSTGEIFRGCSSKEPKFYLITSDPYFDVQFKTDNEYTSKGFLLEFKTVDGCPKGFAQCGSRCVRYKYVCDGIADCLNGEDEDNCESLTRQCGDPHFEARNVRIVGGESAAKYSWPWQVGLSRHGYIVCGGSLISDQWILTAAHCVHEAMDASGWRAILGEHDTTKNEKKEQIMAIEEIFEYPDYNPNTVDGDVALMKLSKRAKLNKYVKTICIADEPLPPAGSNCFVTGWGDTEDTGSRNVLRQVDVSIIRQDVCTSDDYYGNWVTQNMFCAGEEHGGKDACQGDSGGPLVCHNELQNIWYQHGIVSWGIGCADAYKPGVYTRITSVRDWIESKVEI